ncbi:hypothetical protein CAPTEDRAFT_189557 [Capitella teleta]|uniref:G-protein coupled receptors family 1 profile domain-containing protein n=1 Tax=Capitella teleta TaxID=283909 RepID=R7UHZ3_CAPTE|nr:hypothetical protein CAPTEDRAFT_189557 [Capitella teleta]|eukprot:ELU05708.1 hypothetical protein CAPTEDRAFT_189557 [Capitella teleta]
MALRVALVMAALLRDVTAQTEDPSTTESEDVVGDTSATHGCKMFKVIVGGVLLALLCGSGFVGNTLSILTFIPTMQKNATSFILIALAVFDNGVCVIWLINSVPKSMCIFDTCVDFMKKEFQYQYHFVWPVGSMFHLAGTWTIVLVTAYRFMGACYPHAVTKYCTLKKAKIQVLVIAIGSTLFCLPRFFDHKLTISEDGSKLVAEDVFKYDTFFNYFYEFALYYVVIFVIPFTLLVFMTIRLMLALSVSRQRREQMTRNKQDESDMSVTLIVIVIMFMICQVLNPLRRIITFIRKDTTKCGDFIYYFETISSVAILINSCANFVVYCVFSRRFRKVLLRYVCKGYGTVFPMTTEGSANPKINTVANAEGTL